MKECMRPHALLHSLTGVGLGLILVALVPALYTNALASGIVLLGLGLVGEFMRKPESAATS